MTDEATDLNLGDDLGIDVATAELDDDELTRVLEALLLVVDTPVSAQTLATVNGWCWTVLGPSSPARRWRHSR